MFACICVSSVPALLSGYDGRERGRHEPTQAVRDWPATGLRRLQGAHVLLHSPQVETTASFFFGIHVGWIPLRPAGDTWYMCTGSYGQSGLIVVFTGVATAAGVAAAGTTGVGDCGNGTVKGCKRDEGPYMRCLDSAFSCGLSKFRPHLAGLRLPRFLMLLPHARSCQLAP